MKRITQAQIAREVGVNKATVSRALAGDPRISAETAGRVRKLAARLGYRPDPSFAWIANVRWRGGTSHQHVTLAYVSQLRRPHAGNDVGYRLGTKKRAAELGYGLETFFLDDYPDSAALQRILIARGIRWLIVGPFYEPEPLLALDWTEFCAVSCGLSHFEPALHAVTYDPYEEILVAWRRVIDYGYYRPGLVIPQHPRPTQVDDDDRRWAATALLFRAPGTPNGQVPPLFYSFTDPYENLAQHVMGWYRKWKPDVVISLNSLNMMNILQHTGKTRSPGQVGFAQFAAIGHKQNNLAGIKDAAEDVGRATVDLLQLTLRTNQWGMPRTRIRHYVAPEWIDGDTLPRRNTGNPPSQP